jgi:adenylate cyclase
VIAHPEPGLLTRPAAGGGRELVPAGEVADPRARAFLAALPGSPAGPRPVRFAHAGRTFLGTAHRVTGDGRPPWVIAAFVPEDEILAHADRTNRTTVLVTAAVFALAMLAGLLLSRQVARPLERLADQALAVGRLRLEPGPPVRSVVREVDQLARAADAMKVGLRSFGKYLPVDLVRGLLESGQEARLGGERRVLTVAFTDVVGFTAAAEGLASDALVAHLGEYLAAVSQVVADSGGTVDKFLGDGVMAFWGAPAPTADHAADACRAAVRCRDRLAELRPGWVAAGRPPFHTRFGIHTGEVTVGNIGSPTRMNYTVIGDAVNLAARLEALNKYYGTEVIASGPTVKAAGGAVAVRELDVVAVAGRAEPVAVFELLGPAGEVGDDARRRAEGYAAALAHFRGRRWADAAAALADHLRDHPADGPARVLLTRCRRFELIPPPPEWDGVNRMASK